MADDITISQVRKRKTIFLSFNAVSKPYGTIMKAESVQEVKRGEVGEVDEVVPAEIYRPSPGDGLKLRHGLTTRDVGWYDIRFSHHILYSTVPRRRHKHIFPILCDGAPWTCTTAVSPMSMKPIHQSSTARTPFSLRHPLFPDDPHHSIFLTVPARARGSVQVNRGVATRKSI